MTSYLSKLRALSRTGYPPSEHCDRLYLLGTGVAVTKGTRGELLALPAVIGQTTP